MQEYVRKMSSEFSASSSAIFASSAFVDACSSSSKRTNEI